MSTPIQYLRGDATDPQSTGNVIIAHVCNDKGGWGKGFVVAVTKRWSAPEHHYRQWFAGRVGNDFKLGAVQFVKATPRIWVANMLGQQGTGRTKDGPPIRYDALETCLQTVAEKATAIAASVHMPRIGCGLAGGKWEQVEPLIEKTLCKANIPVTVYDFEK